MSTSAAQIERKRQAAPTTESWWKRFRRDFRKGRRKLRFTREGKVFVALTAGIGVGAVNTGNNLLYLLLGAMLGFIVLSGILAEVALRAIDVWRKVPDEIFAGRETSIVLGVRNRKKHLPSFSLAIREHFGKNRALDPVSFVHLPPGEKATSSYRCVFPRRGRCRFRGWTVSTTFPFGLFVKSRQVDGPDTAVVYPRIDVAVDAPLPSGAGRGDGSTRRGSGDEIYALRDYRKGDDRRAIAWKISARKRALITREFARGGHDQVDVFIANVAGREKRDALFESALDYAASLVVHYLDHGFAVGLTTLDDQLAPGTGVAHLHRMLTVLALLRQRTPSEARGLVPSNDPGIDRVVVEIPGSEGFRPRVYTDVVPVTSLGTRATDREPVSASELEEAA